MAARTIALGDVHGCAAALESLLSEIAPGRLDTIITLGDYIDRGSHSRDVIDRLISLASQCELVPLLGNHEVLMLVARNDKRGRTFWLEECGGQETLDSYGGGLESVPRAHFDFLASCKLGYETNTHLFVHANYEAHLPLDQQPEETLLWKHLVLQMPAPHTTGKVAVVGHTPQLDGEVLDIGHLLCIDTFCVGGGWLTAIDVESREIWQADRNGVLRPRP